jgi:hypothetical protein
MLFVFNAQNNSVFLNLQNEIDHGRTLTDEWLKMIYKVVNQGISR